MLKGKAIIELTDVNTGEKTVQVEENIMTNALSHYFNPPLAYLGVPSLNKYSSSYAYQNYLFTYDRSDLSWATSGLVVSNTEQVESPDTLEIPLSTIIGAAAKQYNSQVDDNTRYGSYNDAESFVDYEQGVFSHVFDFPTSACNGTVKCLSIMHPGGVVGLPYTKYDKFKENLDQIYRRKYFVGFEINMANGTNGGVQQRLYHPCPGYATGEFDTLEGTKIGSFSYKTMSYELNHYSKPEMLYMMEKVVAYDMTDGSMYTMTWTAADKFVIRKRESGINTINAIKRFKLLKQFDEVTVTTQMAGKNSNGIACVDKVTKKFYYITSTFNDSEMVADNGYFNIFEVDLTTGKVAETKTFPNPTGVGIKLTTIHKPYTNSDYRYAYYKNSATIHNGNLYVCPNTIVSGKNAVDDYVWYKISLANPSDVRECRPIAGFVATNEFANMPQEIQLIDDKYLGLDDGVIRLVLNVENNTIYNDYSTEGTIASYDTKYTSIPIFGSKFTMFTYALWDSDDTPPYTAYINAMARLDMPMTINNLSTPIHKTPSQTMKITYVLREVDGEYEEGGETE